jgi:ParB-like chromosome segregation protein Spo0J
VPKAQKAPVAVLRDQEHELVDIDSIKEHPDNPNHGHIEAIRASIRQNGFYGSVQVDRATGYILAGNHRWKAAKLEGLLEIPVTWQDVDPVEAVRILLADNETARLAVADEAAVDQLLEQLGDLTGSGFDFSQAERREREAEEEAARQEAEAAALEAEEKRRDPAPGGDVPDDIPDDVHEAQWAVVVVVDTEDAQRELFARMKEEGFTCRVVSV